MHGGTVHACRLHDPGRKAVANDPRPAFRTFASRQRSQNAGAGLTSARHSDGDPVKQQQATLQLQRRIVSRPVR